jgi:transposase
VDAKDIIIAAQAKRIAELEREVADLKEKIVVLMRLLNRNSGNSNQPPSTDKPASRPPKNPSENPKKRGGQKGHRGVHRQLIPSDQVDVTIELYPGHCENCWEDLPQIRDPNAKRYQFTELPPIKPHTTEYRRNKIRCACCGKSTLAQVEGVVPKSPFGPRLMAHISLLTGVYNISRRQAVEFLNDAWGIKISLGALSAIEGRVSSVMEPVVDEVHAHILSSSVKHADATTWVQSGKWLSLWTTATADATEFKVFENGCADTIKPWFGGCNGILVSDRATVFSFWEMKRRQICWAHLKRKFVDFSERSGPAEKLGCELVDYTEIMFRYWHDFRSGQLTRDTFDARMLPLRTQIEACLDKASKLNIKEFSGSCEDIMKHKSALWTFLSHSGVDPTNNHAERELRRFVLWRKCSFGTQSERGNVFAATMMTVAHTARKQKRGVLAFLTACCESWCGLLAVPSIFSAPQLSSA